MRKLISSMSFYLSLVMLTGCLEPYQPPDIHQDVDMLVVDGFINITAMTATVHLTHAVALDSFNNARPEANATVIVERDDATQYTLADQGNGLYQVSDAPFEMSAKYRLHINTNNNKEYLSDYIELKTTPEIDSVTWKADENGIFVLVSTHDDGKTSQYYKWNFEETWEHISSYYSIYKMVDGEAFERAVDDHIYKCWDSYKSTDILVGNSLSLSTDVISAFPLTYVKGGSIKISQRYSVLVQQQTLTKAAYDFWSQLQRTSESLGGLFDPQPYQVLGNIHGVNNDEVVLGYFSGGEVTEKRLFVPFQTLPDHLLRQRPPRLCGEESIKNIFLDEVPTTPNSVLLLDAIYQPGVGIIGYRWMPSICLDCRLSGGVLAEPDFW